MPEGGETEEIKYRSKSARSNQGRMIEEGRSVVDNGATPHYKPPDEDRYDHQNMLSIIFFSKKNPTMQCIVKKRKIIDNTDPLLDHGSTALCGW